MSHLGRWLSAQVDGELDGIERDRVLNHLAGCEACRQEANALRALKRRMTALGDSAADGAIAGRLIERAKSDRDLVPNLPDGAQWPLPPVPGLRPLPVRARQVWPGLRIAVGGTGTGLIVVGLLAFLLGGGGAHPMPKVTPAVDSYWTQHIRDTGQRPTTGAVLIQSLLPSVQRHKTSRSARAQVRRHHKSS
ncbi:MAG TPA: zf-HC2 domain-containing protein [Streptosporangiaceae bacterium]|nr:zf-HC2 domain-containing protein [Streptosporangiaceae bacterium]